MSLIDMSLYMAKDKKKWKRIAQTLVWTIKTQSTAQTSTQKHTKIGVVKPWARHSQSLIEPINQSIKSINWTMSLNHVCFDVYTEE